ncbi:MAG: hypothetical protein JWQ74_234 [Marmoricola sp.]|nr:hypothetical protein [Marmoricola sp.]
MIWAGFLAVIGGTIIGLIGKAVAPGDRHDIPLWVTILCGIGGCLLGSYLYAVVYDCTNSSNCTSGVDWWRHVWQVGVAALLVLLASALGSRKKV